VEPEAYTEMSQLEATHWWYEGMRYITDELIKNVVKPGQPLLILDAGCGTGANLTALSKYGKVYGFDYSPLAVNYSKGQHEGQLVRASVDAVPYPNGTFDLVTSFDVLYHAEVKDDLKAVEEMARVAKPGGYVLLRLPALPALKGVHDIVVHGARRYVAPGLRRMLEEAGLEIERITYANSLLLPMIFAVRKMQEFLMRFGYQPQSDVGNSASPTNSIFKSFLLVEAAWIGRGHSFPAGVSIFAVARKPQGAVIQRATNLAQPEPERIGTI
jgi:SAM-dependent methyltransferase